MPVSPVTSGAYGGWCHCSGAWRELHQLWHQAVVVWSEILYTKTKQNTHFLFLPYPNTTQLTAKFIQTKPTKDLFLHLFLPVLGSSLKQILGLFLQPEYFKIQDQHTFISQLLFLFLMMYFINNLIYFSTCLPTSRVAFSTEAYPLLPSPRHTLIQAVSISPSLPSPPPSSHTIICLLCFPFFHSILRSKI